VAAPAGRLGEEDDRAGRAGWAGQRPRPSGSLAAVAQKKGKESGPAGVEGEVGRGWAKSRVGRELKKILFEFQLILEFGRNLEILYKEI
jgi:hypothetical protein